MGRDCRRRGARVPLAAAIFLSLLIPMPAHGAGAAGSGKLPSLPPLPALDSASPSLSPAGRDYLQHADLTDAPRYALSAQIDPQTGDVDGRMRAEVSIPKHREIRFRMLAGLPALHTGLAVRDVTVGGKRVRAERDQTLLTVPAPRSKEKAVVGVRFTYRVPRAGTTHGRPLTQATIALLSRSADSSQFGHWFPIWLPPGADGDPALSGFGDIGNFAAGAITARVRVPQGWDVASGGITVDRRDDDGGSTTVTESGVGLRDLSLVVQRGVQRAEARAGDVTVRAIGSPSIDVEGTARATADALQTLADRFGPYPWSDLDVIAVSLGPDVGGMEWPGAVWIDGLAGGPRASALTLDHELAHQWWHALVGNDSIRAPVVDEPLAQYSMCVVAAADGTGCGGLVGPGRGSGAGTECADRPTTAFTSAAQYGSLIYDQAPELYFAMASSVGANETIAALEGVVTRHAFGVITPAELRDELVAAFPQQADTVRTLWDRYIGTPGCGVNPQGR